MSEWDVILRTLAALAAGGSIGLERSYHGRAAGLRTYALVCFGSALLVASSQYEILAATHGGGEVTRVIQGIVTGIGFLGAGVIVKEGFTVRGLTTAASVWVASAIGIAFGAGSLLAGTVGVVLTLGALSLLRVVEDRLHVQLYAHCRVAFRRDHRRDEAWLRALIQQHGFVITESSCRLDGTAGTLEYDLIMYSSDPGALSRVEHALLEDAAVTDFTISPSRD